MIMVAVAVMVSIRWVGILMINSLLILPAAAARNITSSAGSYHWTATVFGLLSSVVGLWVSYSCGTSAGATMVLTAAVLFFLTYLIGKSRNKVETGGKCGIFFWIREKEEERGCM